MQNIHDNQKNNRSFVLLMTGKPFHNKPCDKYQRQNFNICVKKNKSSFFKKSNFRNTQKTTFASYKSSIPSSFTEDAYTYVQLSFLLIFICDVITELLTQRTWPIAMEMMQH